MVVKARPGTGTRDCPAASHAAAAGLATPASSAGSALGRPSLAPRWSPPGPRGRPLRLCRVILPVLPMAAKTADLANGRPDNGTLAACVTRVIWAPAGCLTGRSALQAVLDSPGGPAPTVSSATSLSSASQQATVGPAMAGMLITGTPATTAGARAASPRRAAYTRRAMSMRRAAGRPVTMAARPAASMPRAAGIPTRVIPTAAMATGTAATGTSRGRLPVSGRRTAA